MTVDERINTLVNEHGFNEGTARAYVQSSGKCVYCDKNLLNELSDFYAADIDHLLPKSKYPEIESDSDNWVIKMYRNALQERRNAKENEFTAIKRIVQER